MRRHFLALSAGTALTLAAVISIARGEEVTASVVLSHYGDVAAAMYGDAHAAAVDLGKAIDVLVAKPSEETLANARHAWKEARPWYQQTEAYRFGNAIVDDWEGSVNAWPLDEGLIDYTDKALYGETSDENPLYAANVIANRALRIGNDMVDAEKIDAELLKKLHEAGGSEANVATGYHAIEFLLWGQDLNGTKAGAGSRPASDFDSQNCTHENCDRRAAYLKAASDLLQSDLAEMAANWKTGGAARAQLADKAENGGLATILTGIGSLSYGELAGERMKLGLILHDPEEEHDCFSDNTHNSHYADEAGMIAIYTGKLRRRDGSSLEGPGISALAKVRAPEAAAKLDEAMAEAERKLAAIRERAERGVEAYDQMIGQDNAQGNALIEKAIDALIIQTRAVEAVVAALNLNITVEGSDSLDNPSAVQ